MNTIDDFEEKDPEVEALTAETKLQILAQKMRILLLVTNTIVEDTGVGLDSTLNLSTEDDAPLGKIELGNFLESCAKAVSEIID